VSCAEAGVLAAPKSIKASNILQAEALVVSREPLSVMEYLWE
jgi:hypothetical protein